MTGTTTLDELESALRSDDRQRVIELEEKATAQLDSNRSEEQAFRQLALAVRNSDEETAVGTEFLEAVTAASEARAELGNRILSYLADETSEGAAAQAVNKVRSAHQSVAETRSSLRSAADNVNVGAVLAVSGDSTVSIPKGTEFETAFQLQNLGTEPATSIRCSVRSQQTLSVSPSQVESLSDGEQKTLTVSGTPESDGSVIVSAETAHQTVEDTFTVSVLSKAEYIARARQSIEGLRAFVTQELDGVGGDKNSQRKSTKENGKAEDSEGQKADGLLAKFDSAVKKLDKAENHVEKQRPNPANRNLRAAQQQLGAFLNAVAAKRGKSIDPDTATMLTTNTTYTIDTLENAVDAGI